MDPKRRFRDNPIETIAFLIFAMFVFANFASSSEPVIRVTGCIGIGIAVLVYLFGSGDDSGPVI